jgi:DNA repair protein RadA/Sms
MARARTVHRCTECGAASPRWAGRCPGCGEWNTLLEELDAAPAGVARPRARTAASAAGSAGPVLLADVDPGGFAARATGIGELDRVLGGGLVPGAVTLVGGEPGIGKSTLLLQVALAAARDGRRCLLVSAEESVQQARLRAERIAGAPGGAPDLLVLAETDLVRILDAVAACEPDLLIVDSVQTVFDPELGSAPGSVAQVRQCAHELVQEAKARDMATVLVGHVTKEGALAGPRVLEHVVDTVLSFEGDRHHALRMLRAVKHRFGPTGELGLFEMTDAGLAGVPDASGLFLGDRRAGVAGSAVAVAMEGHRPLTVEVQALVAPSPLAMPRRSAQGLDASRLSLLLAVLERRVGVPFTGHDVYASVVGGVRLVEPGADLAVGLALASAASGVPLPAHLVACGEVGLAGEVRQVAHTGRRLAEAARLGFTDAVVPPSAPAAPPGLVLQRVRSLAEAINMAGLRTADPVVRV